MSGVAEEQVTGVLSRGRAPPGWCHQAGAWINDPILPVSDRHLLRDDPAWSHTALLTLQGTARMHN